jgi:hypothetical protein
MLGWLRMGHGQSPKGAVTSGKREPPCKRLPTVAASLLAPREGLEPSSYDLTGRRSAIELPRNDKPGCLVRATHHS